MHVISVNESFQCSNFKKSRIFIHQLIPLYIGQFSVKTALVLSWVEVTRKTHTVAY